ncbi:MAG: hypothetical protein NVS9B10_11030 [Nevskia sp.]
MASDVASRSKTPSRTLRLIALFKIVETAVFAAAGLASLQLLDPATLDALTAWTRALPGAGVRHFAQRVLDQLSGLSSLQIKELGAGAFLFAAIFLLEGVGLWLEKRWAEWLAVVATSLFMPLEVLELFRHATAPKFVALVLNALLVGYLVYRIVSDRRRPQPAT